jgi:hypothetical protein
VHRLVNRHATHADHGAQALLVHELPGTQVEGEDALLDRLIGAFRQAFVGSWVLVYHVIFF